MVLAAILFGLFGLLALWTLISPGSVYWALTAWQYKDPDANEPSDAAYMMSRIGALITLIVLVAFGVQATGWQAEAQTRDDCKTVLLPALRTVVRSKPVAPATLDDFARAHGLTVKTNAIRVPSYQTPRRTASATPSPSATGKSTKKPSVRATPSPTPTPSRTTASRPTTTITTITTYNFQRNRTTVLTWSDGSSTWGPNPSCKA